MKKFGKILMVLAIAAVFIGTFAYLFRRSQPKEIQYQELVPETGSISKSTDGIALKVRRYGTARPHRDKARFHGKALPLLVEGAVHDKVSSG